MSKDRRLGRGLAALLGTPNEGSSSGEPVDRQAFDHVFQHTSPPPVEAAAPVVQENELFQLNVYEIDDNPFQPRRDFGDEEIASLAESLKAHDMLQPVLVRRAGDRFQLISGERRLRAAIRAGWSTIPARLRVADDRMVAELAIVENLQRKDLNAIEKAMSFKRYLEQHACTQEELAGRLKIDRSTIANLMRLLELPEQVIDAVRLERLSAGHARALLPLGDERLQLAFADQVVQEGWSVRETERQVQGRIASEDHEPLRVVGGASATLKGRPRNDQLASLEQELRAALGTKVEIQRNARGRGKVVVHFSSPEEFDRLRSLLTETHSIPRSDAG
ncbi:MAG: ParB/RepB/Spo0J family partition protein [Pirellulaceae bacterium]